MSADEDGGAASQHGAAAAEQEAGGDATDSGATSAASGKKRGGSHADARFLNSTNFNAYIHQVWKAIIEEEGRKPLAEGEKRRDFTIAADTVSTIDGLLFNFLERLAQETAKHATATLLDRNVKSA